MVVVATTAVPVHVLLNQTRVVWMRRAGERDREHERLIWLRKRSRNWSPIGTQKCRLRAERHDEESRQHSHDGSSRHGHEAFLEVISEVDPTFGSARQEFTNGSGTLVCFVPIERLRRRFLWINLLHPDRCVHGDLPHRTTIGRSQRCTRRQDTRRRTRHKDARGGNLRSSTRSSRRAISGRRAVALD